MNASEYTGVLIDSGKLTKLYQERLNKTIAAKNRFKEEVYPAKIKIRHRRFMICRTHLKRTVEEHYRTTYYDCIIYYKTEEMALVLWGRKKKRSEFTYLGRTDKSMSAIAKVLTECTAHNPRLVVRTLRRIDNVTNWYNKRREGLQRAANEVMRQQDKWVQALENEITLDTLKE